MKVVDDLTAGTVTSFAKAGIASGSTISTDAYSSYRHLGRDGYDHQPKAFNPKSDSEHLKWLHTIVSNAKAFILGTFHGLDRKHLSYYLAEFCFRFNRRSRPDLIFNGLLGSCVGAAKSCLRS